jgi:hypothetical protein
LPLAWHSAAASGDLPGAGSRVAVPPSMIVLSALRPWTAIDGGIQWDSAGLAANLDRLGDLDAHAGQRPPGLVVAGTGFEPVKLSRRFYRPLPLAARATCLAAVLQLTNVVDHGSVRYASVGRGPSYITREAALIPLVAVAAAGGVDRRRPGVGDGAQTCWGPSCDKAGTRRQRDRPCNTAVSWRPTYAAEAGYAVGSPAAYPRGEAHHRRTATCSFSLFGIHERAARVERGDRLPVWYRFDMRRVDHLHTHPVLTDLLERLAHQHGGADETGGA